MVKTTAAAEYPMESHGPTAFAASCPATTAPTAPHNRRNAAANSPVEVTRTTRLGPPTGLGTASPDSGVSGDAEGSFVFR